ncbi:hypothetical protein [Tunturiibacter gelidiferens]|uniref:Uncharacterized protein n=1 Tax=Tunturiibacter gelidiferens TaxID=3069689 RepID=A0AAU7Z1N9_9BACT
MQVLYYGTSTFSPSARHAKDLARYEKEPHRRRQPTQQQTFMSKAPAHIVDGLRKQHAETTILYDKTKAALDALPPN